MLSLHTSVEKSVKASFNYIELTKPSQEKKPGVWNGYVILYLREWFLCRYEVTSKDELLQEIYLEEEKRPPE
jgi:hypothetical protein